MKDIQVGDIVHVRGRVYDFAPQRTLLDFNMDDKCDMVWIPTSAVVHIEPRPIKVGDRVRHKSVARPNGAATVMALNENWLWIKLDHNGEHWSVRTDELTRIEGEPS